MIVADHIDKRLAGSSADDWTPHDLGLIQHETAGLAARAFSGDTQAAEQLQRTLYQLFLGRHRPPWSGESVDIIDPPIAMFLWVFAREWDRADCRRHRTTLAEMPAEPGRYPGWIVDLVRRHESNVQHPLFDFLANSATYEQLCEFVRQETPLDLYFADLLVYLAPGIYGRPKLEVAHNFWDEMGRGDAAKAHRALRLRMMDRVGLDESDHVTNADDLVIEEIELANAYFLSGAVRTYATNLIGMLLATESMAPGRLKRQIDGWRRVGLDDPDMEYLLEHTVVDVEHAEDWMREVVQVIIDERPEEIRGITLGVLRRLDIAGRICDRMMNHLEAATAGQVSASQQGDTTPPRSRRISRLMRP
jgi:pyrroloquinoline quinone (PQQ) biosynthesis protein C